MGLIGLSAGTGLVANYLGKHNKESLVDVASVISCGYNADNLFTFID